MARIYEAEHVGLRTLVALKLLSSSYAKRQDARQRFLQEARAAASVKHPNIVNMTDVGISGETPFLVMELLHGEDLGRYLLREAPLAPDAIAHILLPVIAGVQAAHLQGIVHRDLKPENIFLSHGSVGEILPKVLDFGISKFVREEERKLTAANQVLGSPSYMSPEAVDGVRDLTPASDQFSMGTILYECVTGQAPFVGDSVLAVLKKVGDVDFRPPIEVFPGVPDEFQRIILKAMRKNPTDRYPDMGSLGSDLLDFANERDATMWRPTFGQAAAAETVPSIEISVEPGEVSTSRPDGAIAATYVTLPNRSKRAWRGFLGYLRRKPWIALLLLLLFGSAAFAGWRSLSGEPESADARIRASGETASDDSMSEPSASTRPVSEERPPSKGRPGFEEHGGSGQAGSPVAPDEQRTGGATASAGTTAEFGVDRLETVKVDVRVTPKTARLVLDGHQVGRGGYRGTVSADRMHELRISAPGYVPKILRFRGSPPSRFVRLNRPQARNRPKAVRSQAQPPKSEPSPVVSSEASSASPPKTRPTKSVGANNAPILD